MKTASEIASAIGQSKIARHLGVGPSAVNNAVIRGKFPASWFIAMQDLCRAEGISCGEEAFGFKTREASEKKVVT